MNICILIFDVFIVISEPMWLLVAFIVGMAVVPLFKRISSWCKGSKKIKKRKKPKDGKKINDAPEKIKNDDDSVGEKNNVDMGSEPKGINMKLGSTESDIVDDVNKKVEVDETALAVADNSAVKIKVGKLLISPTDKIAFGEKGYVLIGGEYEPKRLVTVKCINLSYHPKNDGNKMDIENDEDEVENENDETKKKIEDEIKDKKEKIEEEIDTEIDILLASDAHPNIIRFHGYELENDVGFLCLEEWKYSLHDLPQFAQAQLRKHTRQVGESDSIGQVILSTNWWKEVGNPSPVMINLIRDVVSGLQHLHKLCIIHRNMTPRKVIVTCNLETLVPKLSDMRISKRLSENEISFVDHATCFDDPGWEAPEQLRKTKETFATDMFRLGCIIFYAFTGLHPFGRLTERGKNIQNNKKVGFSKLEKHPEASDLIASLLQINMGSRPTSTMVLRHPMFWDSRKRMQFFRDASDRLEIDEPRWPEFFQLEQKFPGGFKNWDKKLDGDFVDYIKRQPFRTYKFDRFRHYLRLIRNEMSHHWEMPEEIKDLVGNYPEGYYSYFTSPFPKLFMIVYEFVLGHYKEESAFNMYFK